MKFKRSSLMTKIAVILPAVAATVTLVSLQSQLAEKERQAAELREQVAAVEQENQRLETAIEETGSEESIKAIARQKLGLVESGEIIFYDIGSEVCRKL